MKENDGTQGKISRKKCSVRAMKNQFYHEKSESGADEDCVAVKGRTKGGRSSSEHVFEYLARGWIA